VPEPANVRAALELKAYLAKADEPEVQFRVEIERAGSLDRENRILL
jgi:hypothetical protein